MSVDSNEKEKMEITTDTATAEAMLQGDSHEEKEAAHVKRQSAEQGWKLPFRMNWHHKRTWGIIAVISILFIIMIIFVVYTRGGETPKQSCPGDGNTFVPWGPACPTGWVGYERKCYFFSDEERNWTSGQSFCTSYNSSLAVIQREPEKMFMLRYKGIAGHWIGLKKDLNQTWKWVDGAELNTTLEVKGEGGDCAFLSTGYAISSQCHLPRHWICSHPDMYIRNMSCQIGA